MKTQKILVILVIFWIIATTTGGNFFNGTSGFGQIIFGLSFIGILCHPELYRQHKYSSNNISVNNANKL